MRAIYAKSGALMTYLIPLCVIGVSVIIALSPLIKAYPQLVTAITYDLTLTAPLFFLMLSRKSKVSKLKAVPFFIGGIVLAGYLLPENGQEHLNYIKTYLLPIVEVVVLTLIVRKIYLAFRTLKSNSKYAGDFYEVCKKSSEELFGKSRYASFFCSELSMMYYAFFSWKKKEQQSNEFTNYKENASIALAGALLLLVGIETYTFHILLLKWSSWAAWILTGTSIYTAFMIIGHMKALLRRRTVLLDNELHLKNGLIANMNINLNAIEKIALCSKELQSEALKIGNLGISKESSGHNIAIYFRTPQTIEKIYGLSEKCDILLLHIDRKKYFVDAVKLKLNALEN